MKTKKLLLLALFGCALAAKAQLPNPLDFNTATNVGNTGVIAMGTNDGHWTACNSLGGTYVSPVRVNESGWATPPATNVGWIAFSHTCTSDPAEHSCIGDVDEYYKITFSLPTTFCGLFISDPNTYCLGMDYYADNCVYQVLVNGVVQWTNSGYTSPYNSNNNFGTGQQKSVTLCSGWQPGLNTVIVHVRSGAPTTPGWTGFMAVVNQTLTTAASSCTLPVTPTGCCLGNTCGQTQNPLAAGYEIPLNGNNFYFSADAVSRDKVNVGIACGNNPLGKFNVTTAFGSDPGGSGDSYSIYSTNTNNANVNNTGVFGSASNPNVDSPSSLQRGVWGVANGGRDSRGIFGQGIKGTKSYGGYFESLTTGNGTNYGVYATASGAPTNWAAYFQGNVQINGTLWVNTTAYTSDNRFKKDIQPLQNVNDKIQKLSGYSYSFKTGDFKDKNFDEQVHLGFIAQELKEVFPELVRTDENGFYGVDYQGMIPVLLQAIKEQKNQIENQQSQLNELKATMQALGSNNSASKSINTQALTLSDNMAIVLNQNVPNPFAESTVITYNIPLEFTTAQIRFSTNDGKIIKTVTITDKGKGSITVFANDLSHGVYTYNLIVDGKVIDTKKMIKE